jgi:hypothetical protein
MSKRSVKVPAEVIQKIQKDFELDNYQFADFFGISLSSALDWLKYGIKNQRGHNIALIDSILALQWLADKHPEQFVTPDELKVIVNKIVKTPGLLYMDFLPYQKYLGPSMVVLKHQRLVTAIMATLYSLLLKNMGIKIDFSHEKTDEHIEKFY